MPLNILKKKKSKFLEVHVSTLDADLDFRVAYTVKTSTVFDLVCHTVGLRETWYFGLCITGKNGHPLWLKLDKKVVDQIPSYVIGDDNVQLKFLAKFYPEVLEDELIQEITRHFFYLQFQNLILNGDLRCRPEAAILLASFAVQAKFGDFDQDIHGPGYLSQELLLPQNLKDLPQFQHVSARAWEEQITWEHVKHHGLTRDEAELEYLKIVQDFEMSGVNYFKITDGNGSNKWLGIDAKSVAVYPFDDKMFPAKSYPWSTLADMSFSGNKFTMKQRGSRLPGDASGGGGTLSRRIRTLGASSANLSDGSGDLVFVVDDPDTSKLILELCKGNHDLFMERRKVDSMEVQQMKTQAREEKSRKNNERERLKKEKEIRLQTQREKEEMEERIKKQDDDARQAAEAIRRLEETADLQTEKAKACEEESKLLRMKAAQDEQEIQALKMENNKLREFNRQLEQKLMSFEQISQQLAEDARNRGAETEELREELKQTKKRLSDSQYNNYAVMSSPQHNNGIPNTSPYMIPPQQQQRINNGASNGAIMTSEAPPQRHMELPPPQRTPSHHLTPSYPAYGYSTHYHHITEPPMSPSSRSFGGQQQQDTLFDNLPSPGAVPPTDMQQLSQEIEKERREYQLKSRSIEKQLVALRSEIEVLKVDDKQTGGLFVSQHQEGQQQQQAKISGDTITINLSNQSSDRTQYNDQLDA